MARLNVAATVTAAVLALGGAAAAQTTQAPQAKIEASLTQGVAPVTILFDALKSTAGKGKLVDYKWDFGDESEKNPRTGTGWLAAHTFGKPGKYEVKLAVTDEGGGAANASITITVEEWKGTAYYFSSSEGDDRRTPGQAQNPKTPWKSVDKLSAELSNCQPGTRFLLKRGDTWDAVELKLDITQIPPAFDNPVVIGAYGQGAKPVLQHIPRKFYFIFLLRSYTRVLGGLVLQDIHIRGDADSIACAYMISQIGNSSPKHLTLRRLTVEGFGTAVDDFGVTRGEGGHIFVEDCLFRNCAVGWGCHIGARTHVLLRHNEFDHCATALNGDAFLVEGNYIHHAEGGAVRIGRAANTIIRGNDLCNNDGAFVFGRPGRKPADADKHVLIENNNIHENGMAFKLFTVEDIEVRNNAFWNQQKKGIAAYDDAHGLFFRGNTFFRNTGALFSEAGKLSTEVRIADNIFFHDRKDGCIYQQAGKERDFSNMEWRGNFYCYDKESFASVAGSQQTQDAFMAAIADSGAVVGDPQFTDAEKGNFAPKAGSPAAKKGCDLATIARYLKDVPRFPATPVFRLPEVAVVAARPAVLAAKIEASLTRAVAPVTVMFDALNSTAGKGKLVDYKWDFGDESEKNPRTSTGWLAAHTFVKPGKYEVKLAVEDASGGTAHAAVTITVAEWKGKTYYFSSSQGDDSRTPDQAQAPKTAWKTLDKLFRAMAKCEPGTHFLLKRGDAWEAAGLRVPALPQDAGNPVVIGAHGDGEKPLLQHANVAAAFLQPRSCLTLQDLRLKGPAGAVQRGSGILNDAENNITYLTLRGLTVEDFSCGMQGSARAYVFVEDCLFRNNTSQGFLGGSVDGGHILLRHNEFANNGGKDAVFCHNIYFRGDRFLIEGNHSHHGSGFGINTHHTSDSIIRGNNLHDNGLGPGGGIGLSFDVQGNALRHILVEDNDIHENYLGMWLIGVQDLTIRNNLLRNCRSTAVAYNGMDDLQVGNNTFYRNRGAIFSLGGGKPRRGGHAVIANNIFHRDNAAPPQPFLVASNARGEFAAGTTAVPELLNNLYYTGQAGNKLWASLRMWPDFFGEDKQQQWTSEQWMAFAKETGAVFADPLFVDAENGDLRLKPGSPAVGKGRSLPE